MSAFDETLHTLEGLPPWALIAAAALVLLFFLWMLGKVVKWMLIVVAVGALTFGALEMAGVWDERPEATAEKPGARSQRPAENERPEDRSQVPASGNQSTEAEAEKARVGAGKR